MGSSLTLRENTKLESRIGLITIIVVSWLVCAAGLLYPYDVCAVHQNSDSAGLVSSHMSCLEWRPAQFGDRLPAVLIMLGLASLFTGAKLSFLNTRRRSITFNRELQSVTIERQPYFGQQSRTQLSFSHAKFCTTQTQVGDETHIQLRHIYFIDRTGHVAVSFTLRPYPEDETAYQALRLMLGERLSEGMPDFLKLLQFSLGRIWRSIQPVAPMGYAK